MFALLLGACAPSTTLRWVTGQPTRRPAVPAAAYAQYLHAELAMEQRDWAGAVRHLQHALSLDQKSPYLFARLAVAYEEQGKEAAAERAVGQALRLAPDFPEALLLQAAIDRSRGDVSTARAIYERCIARNPSYGAAYLAYAHLLQRSGQPQRAQSVLQRMVVEVRQPTVGHLQLGTLCVKLLDYPCAEQAYQEVLEERKDLPLVIRLAHIKQALGKFAEATTLLWEAFDHSDGALEVAFPLAVLLDQQARQRELSDVLDLLIRQADDDAEALRAIVELSLHVRQPAQALALLDRAVDWPGQIALLRRAEAHRQLAQHPVAIELLRGALSRNPHVNVSLALSRILAQAQQDNAARAVLQAALADQPLHPDLLSALAEHEAQGGNHHRAIDLLQQAHRQHPASATHTVNLAVALQRAGKWQAAVDLVLPLIERAPTNATYYHFVGHLQADAHVELDQAERLLRQALMLEPGSAQIIDSLGWLFYRQGRLDLAEHVLTMAANLAPREAEVLGHLAEVKAAQNKASEALTLWHRALAHSSDRPFNERVKFQIKELELQGARWQPPHATHRE